MSVNQFCTCTKRGQKRNPNPLQLELQIFVSYHVGSGNQTQVLWKSSQWVLLIAKPYLQHLWAWELNLGPQIESQALYWLSHIHPPTRTDFKKCWNLSDLCRHVSLLANTYLKQMILWIGNQPTHLIIVNLSSNKFCFALLEIMEATYLKSMTPN